MSAEKIKEKIKKIFPFLNFIEHSPSFDQLIESLEQKLKLPQPLEEWEIIEIHEILQFYITQFAINQTFDDYHPVSIFLDLFKVIQTIQTKGRSFGMLEQTFPSKNRAIKPLTHFHEKSKIYYLKDLEGNTLWVFKPQKSDHFSPHSYKGIPLSQVSKREHLACLLNYHRMFPIPYTTYIKVEGLVGSAQRFVLNPLTISEAEKKLPEELKKIPVKAFQKLLLFDLLFANCDRHKENLLVSLSSPEPGSHQKIVEIFGIDHGFCLTSSLEDILRIAQLYYTDMFIKPFEEDIVHWFTTLSFNKEIEILRSHEIEEITIEWMLKVRDFIKQAMSVSILTSNNSTITLSAGEIGSSIVENRRLIFYHSRLFPLLIEEILMIKNKIYTLHQQNRLNLSSIEALKNHLKNWNKKNFREVESTDHQNWLDYLFQNIIRKQYRFLTKRN